LPAAIRLSSPDSRNAVPVFAAAILTWNGRMKARSCLESLESQDRWPFPVVIVDNGSSDREGELLAAEFGPPVTSITLKSNRGVPGGYNAALGWADAAGIDIVLLLNNDTILVDADVVTRLIAASAKDVAAVGPLLVGSDGAIASAGGTINWITGRSSHLRQPRKSQRPYPVEWVEGSCVLISMPAARKIGGFDPEYEAYWEDVDWCVRARRAGFSALVEPRARVVHRQGGTIETAERDRHTMRNAIRFMRRNGSALANLSTLFFFVAGRAPALVVRRLTEPRLLRQATHSIFAALSWHLRDGIRERRWRLPATGPALLDPRDEA
jgi:GT2 family glycosyltransferase